MSLIPGCYHLIILCFPETYGRSTSSYLLFFLVVVIWVWRIWYFPGPVFEVIRIFNIDQTLDHSLRLLYLTLAILHENLSRLLGWCFSCIWSRYLLLLAFVNLFSQLSQPLPNISLSQLLNIIVRLKISLSPFEVRHLRWHHLEKVFDSIALLRYYSLILAVEARLNGKCFLVWNISCNFIYLHAAQSSSSLWTSNLIHVRVMHRVVYRVFAPGWVVSFKNQRITTAFYGLRCSARWSNCVRPQSAV